MTSYEMKNRVELGHSLGQDRDEQDLARLGKKSVLMAGFPRSSSDVCRWITVFAWQSAFASIALLSGTEIQGAAILTFTKYYNGTLILWACVLVALAVNMIGGKLLPRLENLVFAKEVCTTWTNEGSRSSNGIVFFIGVRGSVFAFTGGEPAVHMAEDVQHASVIIPRVLILTILINGVLGFGMLIGTPTGYPYMEIFLQATNSLSGTVTMICISLVIGICSAIGMIAATSRQFWSFARDRVPGWRLWSKRHVSPTTNIPIYSVCFTMAVSCLLGLINIGSDVALKDVLSMAVSGLYLSYLAVRSVLLYRRVCGHIRTSSECEDMIVNVANAPLVWGSFRVPGVLGIVNTSFAICYMIIVIFFSFWPTTVAVDYKSMNYSVVGTFGTVLITVIYYVVGARHQMCRLRVPATTNCAEHQRVQQRQSPPGASTLPDIEEALLLANVFTVLG
ncbi:amino acid permease-domain-containing protein [Aspergillus novoparasiticus]|uniref:Amino acid permease-domain-containing protein n=1 Tax=Aspergillus novoparasiticus TaxID=986946 RepID=A0A5N6EB56_9EURO|nr:amino acid permease-domain-containing protein [Aspergillus novoparasiticus]